VRRSARTTPIVSRCNKQKASDDLYALTPLKGNPVACNLARLQHRLLTEGVNGSVENFQAFVQKQKATLSNHQALTSWLEERVADTNRDIHVITATILGVYDEQQGLFVPKPKETTDANRYPNHTAHQAYFKENPDHVPAVFIEKNVFSTNPATRTKMAARLVELREEGKDLAENIISRLLLPNYLRARAALLVKAYREAAASPLVHLVIEMQDAIGDLQLRLKAFEGLHPIGAPQETEEHKASRPSKRPAETEFAGEMPKQARTT
jgi:hypothetical protein